MKNKLRKLMAYLLVLMLMSADIAAIAEGVLQTLTLPAALKIIDAEAFYGNTSIGKVIVPDGTTEIRSRAFADSSLTEIELPDTLTYIADDAFDGCGEFSVSVPEGCYAYEWAVEMGYISQETVTPEEDFETEVLSDGTLAITSYIGADTEVVIPAKIGGIQVTEIGEGAFQEMGITSVVIPEGVTVIGNDAFFVCESLQNVILPSTLEEIGSYALAYCALDNLSLPEGLVSIGESAFHWGLFTSVHIPSSVEYIGDSVFYGCDNVSVYTVAASNTAYKAVDGVLYSKDGKELVAYPPANQKAEFVVVSGVKDILSGAFTNAANLENITLPEGLESIGYDAFQNCGSLLSLDIPSTCTDISRGAFGGCYSLESINIPEGVTVIDYWMFDGCESLTSVVLPQSVDFIEDGAFDSCVNVVVTVVESSYAHEWCEENGVEYVVAGETIPDTPVETPAEYFTTELLDDETLSITSYIGEDTKVIIPAAIDGRSVTDIASYAFECCDEITSIVIPDGVKAIGEYAFDECVSLIKVTLPDSLISIGDAAFQNCDLRSVSVPDGTKNLGWNVFNNNLSLKKLVIPASVEKVGKNSISWNTVGTGITVRGDIDSYSFCNWTEIDEVIVQSGCTSVGEGAFMDCKSLERIVLPESITTIESRVFSGCESLTEVNIPKKVTDVGDFAFDSCSFSEIELPASLQRIGEYAFQYCLNLTEIEIPYGTKRIEDSAFALCEQLERVVIPSTVTEITGYIFAYGNPDVVIAAPQGSYAIEYAQETGYAYEIIEETIPEKTLNAPQIEASAKTYQSITIAWEAVEDAEDYVVFYAMTEDGEYAQIGTTETCEFTHENLICNTTYYYKLQARSETLISEYSNILGSTTADHIISLGTPANVTVTVLGDKELGISWDMVEGADGYYVLSDDDVIAAVPGMNNCSFNWKNLSANTEYSAVIQAYGYKNNGDVVVSAESAEVSIKTADVLSVAATVAKNELTLSEAITVNASVTGNYGEYVYRYTVQKDNVVISASGECTTAQYSYTPEMPGTYRVVVIATDALGRAHRCQIDEITVGAEALEISNVAIDKNVIMEGESVVIAGESNRPAEQLTYSANVYREGIMVDQIVSIGKLTYCPDRTGTYSFSVEISDENGQTEYKYFSNAVIVKPYWALTGIIVSTYSAFAGDSITIKSEMHGDIADVDVSYTIYRNSEIYRQIANVSQSEYTLFVNDAGTYKCVCTAKDAHGQESSVESTDITVSRKNAVNTILGATHSNTLNVDDLNRKTVRIEKKTTTITWNKLAGDSYYLVYIRCSKLGQKIVLNPEYTGNSYSISSSQLHPGYEYAVDVERYNSSGNCTGNMYFDFVVTGAESLNMESSMDLIVPANQSNVNYDDFTLQWEQMNYAESIEIVLEYYCGRDDHEIFRKTVAGSTTTYTIPKSVLQNGKRHTVEIIAKDSLGNESGDNAVFYVGCEGRENLVMITDPVLISDFLYHGNQVYKVPTYPAYEPILITWEEIPAAEWYSLHLSNKDDKTEIVFDKIFCNYYSIQPSQLVSGNVYDIWVNAHHTDECYRKSVSLMLRAPYRGNLLLDPPKVISPDLSLSEDDPTSFVQQDLTIEWEPVTAAISYDVTLRCAISNSIDFEATGITVSSVTIPREDFVVDDVYGLYRVVISAYDSYGSQTYETYFIRVVKSAISAPKLLYPSLPTNTDDIPAYPEKDLPLVWNTVDGAAEYRVRLMNYYNGNWDLVLDKQGVNEETFTIPAEDLYTGGRYSLRVKAIDEHGNGLYSEKYYFQVGSSQYLKISLEDWLYGYEGGSKNFFITTSQNWYAEASDSWITVNKTNGDSSCQLTVSVTENDDDFPRSGSVTFTNSAGGCAVFSIVQNGNGSSNTGALKITSPEQGETRDYAQFRAAWNYKYDHAYFTVSLDDVTTGRTVYSDDMEIKFYHDIPQSVLAYGHNYRLRICAYNAQYKKISESSVVFRVESLSGGNGGSNGEDDDGLIEDTIVPEGTTTIEYIGITNNSTVAKKDLSVSWQNVIGADYYWVALRDMTLYPEETADADVVKIIDQETALLTVNILAGQLTAGHDYRLWIAAHKTGAEGPISGKNIYFTVESEAQEDVSSGIPSATLTLSENAVVLGDSIELNGTVKANGGILDLVRVTVQDARTGEYCDYAIYDLDDIGAFGSYDSFDLSNVYPIATGEGTSIGTSGHSEARKESVSLNLDKIGYKYNIVVYGKNSSDDIMSVLASEVVVLADDNRSAPRIVYFEPVSETGYKAQEYKFSAETNGSVASVELYIDNYLVNPKIECEEWYGFNFYDLTTPIWEPGTRTCRLIVTSESGEPAEAVCTVEVSDAELNILPQPVFTSPVPYSDGEARGVVNSPFTIAWEENKALDNAEISVTIIRNGEYKYTKKVMGVNAVNIPEEVLDEVGLYNIMIVATQLGYENSKFSYMPLRVYSSVTAIEQDLCPHDGEIWLKTCDLEWKHPTSYDSFGHYYMEYHDKVCSVCGYVLEKHVQTTDDYQYESHTLTNSVYCDCGYCIAFSDDGDAAFLNQTSNRSIYRTPADKAVPIGYLYPYDSVQILYEYENMFYIRYYSDAYKCNRYGFVSTENIESTLTFTFKDEDGVYYVDGVTEGRVFLEAVYYADIEAFEDFLNYSLTYDDDTSKLAGRLWIYNHEYDATYLIDFDLNDLEEGEDQTVMAMSFAGNLVGNGAAASLASVTAPDLWVRFSRLYSRARISIEDLCMLAGFVYSAENKNCSSKLRTKETVLSEILAMEEEIISAIGKLDKGVFNEFYEYYLNTEWVFKNIHPSGVLVTMLENMIAEGVVDGYITTVQNNNTFAIIAYALNKKEWKGEDIAEALVFEKLMELDRTAMEKQGEANLFISIFSWMRENTKDATNLSEIIQTILKATDAEAAEFIEAVTTGETYGWIFTSEKWQDAYNLFIQKPGSQEIITIIRKYNNSFLKKISPHVTGLLDYFSNVNEEAARNRVYLEYKKELLAELRTWAKDYTNTAIHGNLLDIIEKIEKMENTTDVTWTSFMEELPEAIIENGIRFGASLFLDAAKKGIISFGSKAIPIVGQVITAIDFVNALTELAGMDLEQAYESRDLVQVCRKYYNDSYQKASSLVYAISGAKKSKAEECIRSLHQCLYWQNIMIRHACSQATSATPGTDTGAASFIFKYIDELMQKDADQEIQDSQTTVYKYVGLLEEYFNIQ